MDFAKSERNAWSVMFNVNNGTTTKASTVLLSKPQLTNIGPINKVIILWTDRIFSARNKRYLFATKLLGNWGRMEFSHCRAYWVDNPARIIAQEKIQTPAGTFDTSVLGYTIGSNASGIWLSSNVPLPVKAEVYNAQNELQYKYSLFYTKS